MTTHVSYYTNILGLNCAAFASGFTQLEQTIAIMQKAIVNVNQGGVYNVLQMINDYNALKNLDTSDFTQAFKDQVANFFLAYSNTIQTITVSIDAGAGASSPFNPNYIVNGHYAVLYDNNYGGPASVLDLAESMGETSSTRFTTGFIHWNSGSTVPWKGGTMGDDGEIDHTDANGEQIPGWGIQLNQQLFSDCGTIQGPPISLVGGTNGDTYLQSNAPPAPTDISLMESIINQMGFPGTSGSAKQK